MLFHENITPLTPLILRFYARCLVFPYDEMNYELQYMFRMAERSEIDSEEAVHVEQMLNVVNQLQGEETKELRDDFVFMFTDTSSGRVLCPIYAGDFLAQFARRYDFSGLEDICYEHGFLSDSDEPMDNIVNLLDVFAFLCEQQVDEELLDSVFEEHIQSWIPTFCDSVYKASNINYYREVASGLREYILWLCS